MSRIKPGAVVWSLTLLAVAAGIFRLLTSGRSLLYLGAGVSATLGLSLPLLFLLFLASLRQWRDARAKPLGARHLFCLLPLLLALVFQPDRLSQSVFGGSGVLGVAEMAGVSGAVPLPDGPLVLTEGNFLQLLDLLWAAGDEINGRQVELIGFVYNDPSLGPEDFVLARLMITCCADDAGVAGLLCRWSERQTLQEGQWVQVKGKLGRLPFYDLGTHRMNSMPFVLVEQLSSVPKPEQEYVYP